ncbi:hypothetical protein AVEN_134661-1 [Araneus ventricosus]|uniref:Chitin-binding type-2 domain-containing protein n=1 Tax=Araneus ventricosus TaxID=182803 RepID=A0A4Y2F657_ARAVE|nr:hypothetical protein AVEN_134661-1 [Araneus ventricosus]
MFPENFLSRYPHEANPFRLKIFSYLVFNLLVKGYGSVDPSRFWSNYNRDDFYRTAVDAVFYEYLSNFTDREAKDLVFNPLENTRSNLSKPVSNEEIVVDRIGQYLDLLSENKSRPEIIKGAYDIRSETNESPAMAKRQSAECDMYTLSETSGIPGIDYPNFCDIPKTSFSCVGKRIPGIYADYETGCQAFHVCWPRRQDSFLCPIGTIFNQSLFTCDIWHDASCSSSPLFHRGQFPTDGISAELDIPLYDGSCENLLNKPLRLHAKFLPAKCEVRDVLGRKLQPLDKDSGERMARFEMTHNLIKEMLQMLTKMRNELDDQMKSRETSRIHVLAKHLNSTPKLSTETVDEATEFTRKLGETDFKPLKVAEQVSHPAKLPFGKKPGLSVTRSTLLKPSKSLEEHIESSRKQDVPEIVMRSLRLGGTILNEGVIPLAKKAELLRVQRKKDCIKRLLFELVFTVIRFQESLRMWLLLCFPCLLLISNIQTSEQAVVSSGVDDYVYVEEPKDFWKVIFTTYYNLKGLRNATTDKLVEEFFEHKFLAYPKELYPAFEKIFTHISKSNDRIWNFYESILYLYRNVAAADRIYETVLRRLELGKMLNESGELDIDALFPLDKRSKAEFANLEHRSGVIFGEEEPVSSWDEPCTDECGIPPLQVGSIRAIPGVHFPNYDDIPITSFTCAGMHIPAFYADLETGCQVFHVCYAHRRESFLCPVGTTFNQAILACDYWYSSNCSLAPLYFNSGLLEEDEHVTEGTESFVDHLLGQYDTTPTPTRQPDSPKRPGKPKSPKIKITLPNIDWTLMIKFLPIKSKITECPDFCETTTTAHPIESTTTSRVPESTVATSTRPVVSPTPTVVTKPPEKSKYEEKTAKSEILLDILKAVEVLTKDAEGFLSKMLEKKRKHHDIPTKKPTVAPRFPTKKPKPFPEINPRFVVKPVKIARHLPRPTVSRSKSLEPSKQILKSNMEDLIRKKEPAKLVLEGMKAIAHLFD